MKYYIGKSLARSGAYMRLTANGMVNGVQRATWMYTIDKDLATRFGNEDIAAQSFKDGGIRAKVEAVSAVIEKRGRMHVGKFSNALADAIQARYNQPRMPHRDELLDAITNAVWNAPDEADDEGDEKECEDDDEEDDPKPRKMKRKP